MGNEMAIRDHMNAIEALGGVVVVFVAGDMPGVTEERRKEQLREIRYDIENRMTEAGSDLIDLTFGDEDEDEEGEEE